MRLVPLDVDPFEGEETSETAKLRLTPIDYDPTMDEVRETAGQTGIGLSPAVSEFLRIREARRGQALGEQGITPTDMEQPRPDTTVGGVAKALGHGIARGLTVELPAMVGGAAEFAGGKTGINFIEQAGKSMKEFFEQVGEELYGPEPKPEEMSEVERWVYEGSKMLAPSAVPGGLITKGIQVIGGVGKLVKAAKLAGSLAEKEELMGRAISIADKANKFASMSVAALFGGSQAQSSIDTALKRAAELEAAGDYEGAAKMQEAAAGWTPWVTGAIEATGEYFGTKYLSKLFGLSPDAVAGRGGKQIVTDFLKTLGVETGTEFGQQFGQATAEKVAGIRPDAEPLVEALDVLGPTAFMTLLTGGLAGGSAKIRERLAARKEAKETEMFDTGLEENISLIERGLKPGREVGDRITTPVSKPMRGALDLLEGEIGQEPPLPPATEPAKMGWGALEPVDLMGMAGMGVAGQREEGATYPEAAIGLREQLAEQERTGFVPGVQMTEAEASARAFEDDQIQFLRGATDAIINAPEGTEQAQIEQIVSMGTAKGINPVVLNQTIIDAFRQKAAMLEAETEEVRPFVDRAQAEAAALTPEAMPEMPAEAPAEAQARPETSPLGQAVEEAGGEIATEPTPGQIEAGNYKKGHIQIHGIDITIENPKGSTRKGTDKQGKAWETVMKSNYGYIRRTQDETGEQVDVFVGPRPESENIFVIKQNDPVSGKFDEYKVMMGFDTLEQAKAGYLENYEPGWKGMGEVIPLNLEEFKTWLKEGVPWRGGKPAEEAVPAAEEPAAPKGGEALKGIKVKIKGRRAETGERIEIEVEAQDALDDNTTRMECFENILECLNQ